MAVEELWSDDFEVLAWVVERFESDGDPIMAGHVVNTFPGDRHDAVRQSLRRLSAHGYLESIPDRRLAGRGGGSHPMSITGVTERALRAVGAWPDNAEVLADRMLAALAERAANEPDPAKRSKFAAGLKGFGGMTRDLLVEVAGSAISKSVGGG